MNNHHENIYHESILTHTNTNKDYTKERRLLSSLQDSEQSKLYDTKKWSQQNQNDKKKQKKHNCAML